MDPNNLNTVRITLVIKDGRYLGYINQGMVMPDFKGGDLISTSPYSKGENYKGIVKLGKAKLNQDINTFHKSINFNEIEFIELSEMPEN
ncbi:MAG: hypothetical protein HY973_04705 [Candidatus Kerfeldbacteria bacterium]|nr:hypothetical protein [Candidatus Kerfeldbacteria bacterium]